MAYLVGNINTIPVPICIDTGAGKSLMSLETWNRINANNKLSLKPQFKGFEAVNGSRINCQGSAVVKLMLMGETKNYVGYFKFFVVDHLAVDALMGIDEIHRHSIRLNNANSFASHDRIGKFLTNIIYKPPYDVGTVLLDEDITLDANASKYCKIAGSINLGAEEEALVEPLEGKNDVLMPKSLVNGNTECSIITNPTNHTICIEKGTTIGNIYANRLENAGMLRNQNKELADEDDDGADDMGISIEPDEMVDTCDFGLNNSDLTEKQKAQAKTLLAENKDLFQWGDGPLSCAHKYEHEIRLIPGAKPVKHKTRRFSVDQQKVINEEVEKLLRQKIIEKSNSPWSSRIVLAWNHYKKKYRVCLDLRDLNARSLADNYPLPNLQDLLNKLAGNKYFSTLDLYAGFHQFNLKKECREYTAFQTPRHGLVHYIRVPFGAKTAPNGFERLMEEVLGDLHNSIALVFIDDLCIFSNTPEEGLIRLKAVLDKLRTANMKLRPSKCKLLQVQVEYLGSVVSQNGIAVASRIIDAVTNFKQPVDPKGVMRFAGLANFYREHIQNFADIMHPLVNLTKKKVKWEWSSECNDAFEKMKKCLVEAPVRNFVNFDLPLVLSCDASAVGLGCVLSNLDEQGRMLLVAYGSKTLKGPERHWTVTEKELFSIYTFVKKFKHFLGGRKFLVQSDHHALQFISGARDSTGKITRMLNFLQGFDFEIHYIPGSKMDQIGPDILSRCMVPLDEHDHDVMARKLERPVLKLNHNFSPFLASWFSIETPKPSYFDKEGNLKVSVETLGYNNPVKDQGKVRDGEEKLYCNLRKIVGKQEETESKTRAVEVPGINLATETRGLNLQREKYSYWAFLYMKIAHSM